MKLYATLVFFILGSASLHAADGPSVLAPVLQSFVDKRIAPGVVALVADKDGVLALDKAGYASLANKTPIRDDAVFWIASMSKSLTGTALMMLVDQGKLSAQESYGIGWSVKLTDEEGPSAGSFGHRGARRTAMWVDPHNGLALVLLVERFDMTGPEQKEFYSAFMKAAIEKYGRAAVGAGAATPGAAQKSIPPKPVPTHADVSYGPSPLQLMVIPPRVTRTSGISS